MVDDGIMLIRDAINKLNANLEKIIKMNQPPIEPHYLATPTKIIQISDGTKQIIETIEKVGVSVKKLGEATLKMIERLTMIESSAFLDILERGIEDMEFKQKIHTLKVDITKQLLDSLDAFDKNGVMRR